MSQPKRPQHIPTVKWAMTPFPWFSRPSDDIEQALELMREQDIRHLPVQREGELVGIVTQRDIQLAQTMSAGSGGRRLRVEDVCAFEPYVVDVGDRLDGVLVEMARRKIGSALVVKQGKLAGIFTATDACRAFGDFLRAMFPDGSGDEAA
ncbi:MAG: CBS domain-containing protein [Myxococcota bacterium]|nr:CBS domain-containing protein [Myxococcota bacterium]